MITRSGHKIQISTSCSLSLSLCWCVYNGFYRSRSYVLITLEWSRKEMSAVYTSVSGSDSCMQERYKARLWMPGSALIMVRQQGCRSSVHKFVHLYLFTAVKLNQFQNLNGKLWCPPSLENIVFPISEKLGSIRFWEVSLFPHLWKIG